MQISVIIPTYNRRDSLLRALQSLVGQSLTKDDFEAVVVDDGGTDSTGDSEWTGFPFTVRYHRQRHLGATKARNTGARHSSSEILVFMDDDIAATPDMLAHLVQDISGVNGVIVMATLIPAVEDGAGPFAALHGRAVIRRSDAQDQELAGRCGATAGNAGAYVHFTECTTGVLAVRRHEFLSLGMFQQPTTGWPNWDDVDFGYRAYLQGFRLWRSARAVAYHYDHALGSLDASCERWERASREAVQLFLRHPELRGQIPMFVDKEPVSLSTDSPRLLVLKSLRNMASSTGSVTTMRWLGRLLERTKPDSSILGLLYRWIISACIFRGYRLGLGDMARDGRLGP